MNVLVVTADERLRARVAQGLREGLHQVALASTAAEALAKVRDFPVDVAAVDLAVAPEEGLGLWTQLRAARPAVEFVAFTPGRTAESVLDALTRRSEEAVPEFATPLPVRSPVPQAWEGSPRLAPPAERDAVELVGQGPCFEDLQRFITRVGPSDSAVLLRGETGTGKELVARALHQNSRRREQPLVVLDCAAMTESLLLSELFGHEKGAFTGATHLKRGLFELADGGTAFLDEIGDLGAGVQASLLRVLETSSFRRVGGTKELTVDVRIIAATHRPLERMMKTGAFREDLYFRLNTIHHALEPLRRRRAEIPCLVAHLVARHDRRTGGAHEVSPETMALLTAHDWPGNIRELRHVVERALLMAEGPVVGPAALPPELRHRTARGTPPLAETPSTLSELEAQHMAKVLAQVGGHRAQAARLLGISERSLYRKIIEYRLDSPGHRGPRS